MDVTITVGAAGSGVLGDTTGDGRISKAEVIAAFDAYIQRGEYTKVEIIGIFRQYVRTLQYVTRRLAGERHRTKRTMFRSL